MTELLVVSGAPLWLVPGGRTAALVEGLAALLTVRVLSPAGDGRPPPGSAIVVDPLPDEDPVPRMVGVLSPQSRRGRELLGPRRSQVLLQALADHRPGAVLFTHGYLAAASPTIDRPVFVDFPELSVRTAGGLEGLKARWWEPVEARRAVVASAATAEDVARLESWGARAMLVPVADAAAVAALAEVIRSVG